jgi:hypothetical protein
MSRYHARKILEGLAPSVKCILENISYGTREPVLPVVLIRQRIVSEVRSADAPGNIRHGPERMVQNIVQFEDHARRRGDVEADGRSSLV